MLNKTFVFSIFDNLCFGIFCLLWVYLLWILVVYSIGIREHRGSDAPYLHKKTVFVNCRFPKTGDIIADIPETVRERSRSQYGKTGGNDQKNAHFIF